jgi:hypothetical protein
MKDEATGNKSPAAQQGLVHAVSAEGHSDTTEKHLPALPIGFERQRVDCVLSE